MSNWVDIMAAAPWADFLAITIEDDSEALDYWRPFLSRVRVAVANVADARRLNTYRTPVTLLVERGVATQSYAGPLQPPQRKAIIAWLRERADLGFR